MDISTVDASDVSCELGDTDLGGCERSVQALEKNSRLLCCVH